MREMPVSGKLVRDRVPDLIRQDGRDYDIEILRPEQMWDALSAKLHEEAAELAAADTDDERLEELADLFEVLQSLARTADIPMVAVIVAAERKRFDKGGFVSRIWLY